MGCCLRSDFFALLRGVASLDSRPEVLDHEVFARIFKESELLKMDLETRDKVRERMTTERDLRNQMKYAMETAIAEGLAEGLAEGRAEGLAEGRAKGLAEGELNSRKAIAKKLKEMGMSLDMIAEATGLDADTIEAL